MRRWVVGGSILACAACGSDATVLFEEDFSGSYPGANWVGQGAVDSAMGEPAPSLFLAAVPPLAMTSTQMAETIDLAGGVTLSFDAANVASGVASDVNLLDVNTNMVAVHVEFRPAQVRLYINGDSAGVVPVAADTEFHAYEVSFNASGLTTWRRDGAIQLEGQLGFTPARGRLVLRTDQNGFFIDNVAISAP